jgi:flagellar basal body-associated protein FliL
LAVDDKEKDHNTLHIKKDAGQESHYYYNREERLSQPAASKLLHKNVKEKKIRRSSLIILLDIMLIIVAFILFHIFVFGTQSKVTLRGFSFTLKQIVTEKTIVASMSVKRVSASEQTAQTEAHITFSLPDSNKSESTSVQLPEELDKENIARVNFPYTEQDKTLKAHITLGTYSEELSLPIKK